MFPCLSVHPVHIFNSLLLKPVTNEYDIALLELTKPMEFSQSIEPVCLPSADHKIPLDGEVIFLWNRRDGIVWIIFLIIYYFYYYKAPCKKTLNFLFNLTHHFYKSCWDLFWWIFAWSKMPLNEPQLSTLESKQNLHPKPSIFNFFFTLENSY